MNRIVMILGVVLLVIGAYFFVANRNATPEPFVPQNEPQDEEDGDNNEAPEENNDDDEPLPQGNATVVRTLTTSQKVVVLTFDAGSDVGFAAQILETLKQNNIKASFGMTGKWAQENPELVKRMASEGHDFINHTWTHSSFTGFSTNDSALTQGERWDELVRTEDLINSLTGVSTKPFFRPPYGDYDASVNRDIYSQGYTYNIMWTVDSLGWKGLTKEEITARVVNGTVPGAIHLFHVGEQSQDSAALQSIITELKAKGYTFSRLSDML